LATMAHNTLSNALGAGTQDEHPKAASDRSVLSSLFTELHHDLTITRRIALIGFLAGLVVLAVWGAVEREKYVLSVVYCGLACYATGALGGFLFGIPRVLQKPSSLETPHLGGASDTTNAHATYELLINTNLDDISDWLTKIVVGVGLVELREIPGTVYRYSALVAGSNHENRAPLVCAVMVYFAVLGFMSGYLTTRMFFERAFRIADLLAAGTVSHAFTTKKVVETQTISAGSGGESH